MNQSLIARQVDSDRRRFGRSPLKTWVFLEEPDATHLGLSFDISPGGLGITCPTPIPSGKVIDLWILLPNGSELSCLVQVVRSGEQRLGLRFVELEEDGLAELSPYVDLDDITQVRRKADANAAASPAKRNEG